MKQIIKWYSNSIFPDKETAIDVNSTNHNKCNTFYIINPQVKKISFLKDLICSHWKMLGKKIQTAN